MVGPKYNFSVFCRRFSEQHTEFKLEDAIFVKICYVVHKCNIGCYIKLACVSIMLYANYTLSYCCVFLVHCKSHTRAVSIEVIVYLFSWSVLVTLSYFEWF